MTCSAPPFIGGLLSSDSPLIDGVSGSRSGGVVLVAVRSGVLAAGDGELWGSGVGVRSDLGEQDLRFPGAGDEFCWGRRSRSFSSSWASRACGGKQMVKGSHVEDLFHTRNCTKANYQISSFVLFVTFVDINKEIVRPASILERTNSSQFSHQVYL